VLCLFGNATDIFKLPVMTEYVEKIKQGGDGCLEDNAGISSTGEGQGSGDLDCTVNDSNYNMLCADNSTSRLASTGLRSHLAEIENAP
jgi:hypothetical protein